MKLVSLIDLDGNEFRINPNDIIKIIEGEDYRIVETLDGEILTKSCKLSIEAGKHNCYLP